VIAACSYTDSHIDIHCSGFAGGVKIGQARLDVTNESKVRELACAFTDCALYMKGTGILGQRGLYSKDQ
jgi:hypothetical protein